MKANIVCLVILLFRRNERTTGDWKTEILKYTGVYTKFLVQLGYIMIVMLIYLRITQLAIYYRN